MELYPLPLEQLQEKLNYTFHNIQYLRDATTHSSFAHEMNSRNIAEPIDYNERLEFLGDSVLSVTVCNYLYCTYPELPEGRLTVLRKNVVCQKALADYAMQISLGDYLLLGRGEAKDGREKPKILESKACTSSGTSLKLTCISPAKVGVYQ